MLCLLQGTYYFMAYEILDVPGIIHNTHHDLESFYWVLLWVVVRHTAHDHMLGDDLCSLIFTFGNDNSSAAAKMKWLESGSLNIPKNKPLTYLMDELACIVLDHLPTRRKRATRVLLDYEGVLKIFDEAIKMPGWPNRDWQPCKLLKGDGRTGIADVVNLPGVVTALDGDAPPANGERKLPPLPTHPDLPAPHSLDPRLLPDVSPKKRTCQTLDEEEDELDSRGTSWMSESPDPTSSRRKRVKTNEGPRRVTRSQSRAGQEPLVAPRQSARVRAALERKLHSEGT